MSNYTQTTFFTPKDSLPITDPNKTIFGAAYDVEFANISAAMVTKLDSVFTNPALISLNITGAATPPNGFSLPSANTLAIYTNSTQRATISSAGIWTMTAAGQAGGILNVIGNNNTSVDIIVQNLTNGNNATTTLAVNDNTTNFGFMELQAPLCAAAVTGGVTGSVLNVGTNATFPMQMCINDAVVATFATNGGFFMAGATGGSQGAGTINATGLFVNGSAVSTSGATQIFTAATNASTISVGSTWIIYRTGTANITGSISPTIDTVLQFTNLPTGTYVFEGEVTWTSSSTIPGVRYRWQLSTLTTGGNGVNWASNNASGSVAAQWPGFTDIIVAAFNSTSGLSSVFNTGAVTGSGTLAVYWAQGTSTGTATTISALSYVKVTRLA